MSQQLPSIDSIFEIESVEEAFIVDAIVSFSKTVVFSASAVDAIFELTLWTIIAYFLSFLRPE